MGVATAFFARFIILLVLVFEVPKLYYLVFGPDPYHILPQFGGPESLNPRTHLLVHDLAALLHVSLVTAKALESDFPIVNILISHAIFGLSIFPNMFHLGNLDLGKSLAINLGILAFATVLLACWVFGSDKTFTRFHLGFLKSPLSYMLVVCSPVFINLFGFFMYMKSTGEWYLGPPFIMATVCAVIPALAQKKPQKTE